MKIYDKKWGSNWKLAISLPNSNNEHLVEIAISNCACQHNGGEKYATGYIKELVPLYISLNITASCILFDLVLADVS